MDTTATTGPAGPCPTPGAIDVRAHLFRYHLPTDVAVAAARTRGSDHLAGMSGDDGPVGAVDSECPRVARSDAIVGDNAARLLPMPCGGGAVMAFPDAATVL